MGKKVTIPINGVGEEQEAVDEQLEAAHSEDTVELADGEDVADSVGEVGGLDAAFADRDVDFSDFEEQAAATGSASGDTAEMVRLQAEVQELQQKYLRSLADMDNLRKRSQKERSDLLKYQGEKILADIIDVLDNLELALQHKDAEIENLRTGVQMIHQQFKDVLDRWGVRAESAVGSQFDPNKQNAINKVPAPDAAPGSVVAELKKTYFYKDKLLRVGEVVVAEGSQPTEKNGESSAQE
jgi:molecular chaperone GrpE